MNDEPDELNGAFPLEQPELSNKKRWYIVIAVVVCLAGWGIASRLVAEAAVAKSTRAQGVQIVTTVTPQENSKGVELVLPGQLKAYYDSPIYARTSGYLKSWLVDIGAKVHKGQLLAEIDAPEVDQQLLQAQADFDQAKANEGFAAVSAKRWKQLQKTDSVAQQDTDQKISGAEAAKAAQESAAANVARLRQLQDFEKVYAPFDGVITARNTDIGTLINAGSATGQQLFEMAETDKLRVYVSVPETYAAEMTPDIEASIVVQEHPGKSYPVKLVSTSESVDPATRTLLVQLEVDNADGALLAGAYTDVHFVLPPNPNSLRIPVSALLFRADGVNVATVDGTEHIVLKPVLIGRDYGNELEIISGLGDQDKVVVNVPDSMVTGDAVRLAADSGAKPEGKTP